MYCILNGKLKKKIYKKIFIETEFMYKNNDKIT